MKLVGQWVLVLVSCAISAYYLNWIAYQVAPQQDGSVTGVLRMAMKWYGLPVVIPIQLLIWWAMPRLFCITPSPWIATIVWPLASAICTVIVVWRVQKPELSDCVAIVGMLGTVIVSWLLKLRS